MKKFLIILSVFSLFITGCQSEKYIANVTELQLVRMDPSSGYAGAIVKILGRNFSPKTTENKVTIGGLEAKVLEATEWDLTVVLPTLPNGEYEIVVETPKGTIGGLMIVIKEKPAHVYLASILAGTGKNNSEDGSGSSAGLSLPEGIIPDGKGEFYILQRGTFAIRKMNTLGMVTTLAITGEALNYPWQGAADPSGVLYFANKGNSRLMKMEADGVVKSVSGFDLNNPMGLKFAADGTGYLANRNANEVIKFKNDVVIEKYSIPMPTCVAIDAKGRVLVGTNSDGYLYMIGTDGTPVRVAGEGNPKGPSGDGVAGDLMEKSTIGMINGMYIGTDGAVYLADTSSQTVRKLTPDADGDYSKGKLETIASGFYPSDIYVSDDCTKIYVTSATSHTIRLIE